MCEELEQWEQKQNNWKRMNTMGIGENSRKRSRTLEIGGEQQEYKENNRNRRGAIGLK